MKRAAIYVRVSTDGQTVENQARELRQVSERRGWQIVETYSDAGISGATSGRGLTKCSRMRAGEGFRLSWRGR